MLEMIAVWLKRGDDKQPFPTWRGLCCAIASVDRRAAEGIARDHPCQCSYFTGSCKVLIIFVIINVCVMPSPPYKLCYQDFMKTSMYL